MPKPPSEQRSLSPTRRFELRVRPEQPGFPWCATLNDEQQPPLEFSSPLELARFLADLSGDAPEDPPAPITPTGLR